MRIKLCSVLFKTRKLYRLEVLSDIFDVLEMRKLALCTLL